MAELASRNAGDPDFESPYTQEALQEGIDLPIWEKLMGASFKVGVAEGREVPANQQIWSSVRTPGKGQPACLHTISTSTSTLCALHPCRTASLRWASCGEARWTTSQCSSLT